MFDRFGERFVGNPGVPHRELAGFGERVQSRGEPFVGQHRGMDSVGDAPQRVDRRLQFGGRRAEKFGAEGVALREVRPGHAQADQQGHQTLLGAVMEVAFQPAALAIARPR